MDGKPPELCSNPTATLEPQLHDLVDPSHRRATNRTGKRGGRLVGRLSRSGEVAKAGVGPSISQLTLNLQVATIPMFLLALPVWICTVAGPLGAG